MHFWPAAQRRCPVGVGVRVNAGVGARVNVGVRVGLDVNQASPDGVP